MAHIEEFLENLAREDAEVNGLKFLINDWMFDYDGYFEEEEDEDNDGDGVIHPDEGIGEETPAQNRVMLEATEVWFRQREFCVITSAIKIVARNVYYLCGGCYIRYVDFYTIHEIDHEHVMEHFSTSAGRAMNVSRDCSSCHLPLTQICCTVACLICHPG